MGEVRRTQKAERENLKWGGEIQIISRSFDVLKGTQKAKRGDEQKRRRKSCLAWRKISESEGERKAERVREREEQEEEVVYQMITRNSKYDSISSSPIYRWLEEGAEAAADVDNCIRTQKQKAKKANVVMAFRLRLFNRRQRERGGEEGGECW